MKKFFLENKIKTPKKLSINKKTMFPAIFKPEVGAGSYGVKRIKNQKEFVNFRKNLPRKGFFEEYINGELYHIDGYSTEKENGICTILKKNFTLIDNIPLTSSYEVLGLNDKKKFIKLVKPDLKKILTKLNIKRNILGIYFLYKNKNIYFIEIGLLHDCYTDYLYKKLKIDIYKFFISLIKGKILRNEIKKFDKIKKS